MVVFSRTSWVTIQCLGVFPEWGFYHRVMGIEGVHNQWWAVWRFKIVMFNHRHGTIPIPKNTIRVGMVGVEATVFDVLWDIWRHWDNEIQKKYAGAANGGPDLNTIIAWSELLVFFLSMWNVCKLAMAIFQPFHLATCLINLMPDIYIYVLYMYTDFVNSLTYFQMLFKDTARLPNHTVPRVSCRCLVLKPMRCSKAAQRKCRTFRWPVAEANKNRVVTLVLSKMDNFKLDFHRITIYESDL